MDDLALYKEIRLLNQFLADQVLEPIHKKRYEKGGDALSINTGQIECDYVERFSVLEILGRHNDALRESFNGIEWGDLGRDHFQSGYLTDSLGRGSAALCWVCLGVVLSFRNRLVFSQTPIHISTTSTQWMYYVVYAILDKGCWGTRVYLPSWSRFLPTEMALLRLPTKPEHAYLLDFA